MEKGSEDELNPGHGARKSRLTPRMEMASTILIVILEEMVRRGIVLGHCTSYGRLDIARKVSMQADSFGFSLTSGSFRRAQFSMRINFGA